MSRKTTMRALALVTVVGLGMTTAACTDSGNSKGKSGGSSKGSSASKTLVVEDAPVPSFTENFNPFTTSSFSSIENANSLVFEPLFQFNTLDASAPPIPWLAKDYTWSNGNKTLTLKLQDGVKWSDGQAFSSDDVVFTFNLLKQDGAANTGGTPIPDSVSASDPSTVVLNYKEPQAANFIGIGNQLIVPKHIWSSISKPSAAVIKADQAIGTGPYLVDKFSAQNITYKVNPSYRQGEPAVKAVSFPAYATNDTALLALTSGKIDLTGNNIANVQNVFVAKDPAHNHLFMKDKPYFPSGNTVTLTLNLKSTGAPALADKAVRQAISAGLNRAQYATQCETDYEIPATSSGGLLLPADQKQLDPALANDLKPTADAGKVTSILSGAGWKKNSSGKWEKDGKTIKFTIIDPNSFTDYWCAAGAMAKDLNAVGMDVSTNGQFDFNSWNTAITSGKYDAAIHWGQGGTPFQRLQYLIDPNLTAPVGKTAAENFSRYDNPAASAAVKAYQNSTDEASGLAALKTLQDLVSTDAPAIPVLYGASWYEYNDTNFTGWPNSDDPYINPGPNSQAYEYMILKLKPRS